MSNNTDRQQANVRNVDPGLWRRLRVEAVTEGKPLGQLLNEIIREWVDRRAEAR